ncbi:MAG: hypothetical protein WCK89_11425 [bacterium]
MQSKKMGYMSAIILAALLVQPAAAVDINVNTAITTSTNFNGVLNIGNTASNVAVTMTSGALIQNTTGTIGNGKTNNSVTVSDSGTLWNNTASLTIGSSAGNVLNVWNGGTVQSTTLSMSGVQGQMNITNGGKVYGSDTVNIGNAAGANSNRVTVIDAGSLWSQNNKNLNIGNAASAGNVLTVDAGTVTNADRLIVAGVGNGLVITNGGKVYNFEGGNQSGSIDGFVRITGTGSLWNSTSNRLGNGGQVLISNGGAWNNLNTGGQSASTYLYIANGGYNASIIVSGANSILRNDEPILIGNAAASTNNSLIVTNGGSVVNSGTITVGVPGKNNYITIAGSGSIFQNTSATALSIGNSAGASDNKVIVTDGGLLDSAVGFTVGLVTSTNNTLTASGGILQFASVPTITLVTGVGNQIVFTNATLAYRDIQTGTLPNLTNNWGGATTVAAFTWQGATNTFRLNNALANNTLGRPYVFSSALGATNYARLEMINGLTAVSGAGGVTIASDGSLLISNTEARIGGPFTNSSANVVLANAVLEANTLNNQGAAALTNFGNGRISGGFQFTTNRPSITSGAGIALNNGVLSYRSVTNADVRANQVGWAGANDTANITLLGSNGFELNWSTNTAVAATPQDYTFSAGLGATNFAGLAMVNGTTRYRNGSVTIAPDGWLLITNTTAIFDNAVTNLGSAQTVNSKVTYTGAYVTTNSAVNQVLNSTVNYNGGYVNLSSGGITNWIINSTLNALGYTVSSGDLLGFGATSFWGVDTNSSAGFQIASGGSMWVSNNAYTVFTVPLTNAGAVQISANAVLETKAISNTGRINSDGGYLLFATNKPAITTGVGGIVVTNGGIGYGGGIANADVRANQVGWAGANDTTNITFQGPTVFMLNNGASNTMALSQSYTFDPGLGATTNFAGLVLGGSSLYRTMGGDIVTFTNNASMLMLNSTATYTIGNGVSNVTYNVCGTNGGGTVWNNGTRPLTIGSGSATGNVLNVAGGQVTNLSALTIGSAVGANGNVMNVRNSGTVYGTTLDMKGLYGQLNITDSGVLNSSGAVTIGNGSGCNSNQASVLSGGLWNSGNQTVTIGNTAHGNVLTVNNGIVTNANTLQVGNGNAFTFNSLIITNGGRVYSTSGTTGASDDSRIVVTGSGSIWTNSSTIMFGYTRGGRNSMAITAGGRVYCSGIIIGHKGTDSSHTNNSVTVSDAGSYFYVSGSLQLGNAGDSGGANKNYIAITNGGVVFSGSCNLGTDADQYHTATVADSGSIWTNAGVFSIGYSQQNGNCGSNNLIIANGGKVYNNSAIIGNRTGGVGNLDGNKVTVTGSGSILSNSASLMIGNYTTQTKTNVLNVLNSGVVACTTLGMQGMYGQLNITNAGTLNSSGAVNIGGLAGAHSNIGTVTDAGSVWDLGALGTKQNLTIGLATATNNALTVANGGVVTNVDMLTISATNSLNLFGGTVYATNLTMGVGAKIGFDRTKPGSLKVAGAATLNGTLDLAAFNMPAGTRETFNFLTYGTLSGSIALGGAGATPPSGQFVTLTTNTVDKVLVLTMWRTGGTLILVY